MLGERSADKFDVDAYLHRGEPDEEERLAELANRVRPLATRLKVAPDVNTPIPQPEVDTVILLPPSVPRPIGRAAISSELL